MMYDLLVWGLPVLMFSYLAPAFEYSRIPWNVKIAIQLACIAGWISALTMFILTLNHYWSLSKTIQFLS